MVCSLQQYPSTTAVRLERLSLRTITQQAGPVPAAAIPMAPAVSG